MSYHSKRPYGGGGGGGRYPPQRSKWGGDRPQPTELRVLTNQNKLVLSSGGSASSDESDYVQCEVSIKNAFWKRIKDEATGEYQETREFSSDTRERDAEATRRFFKTPLPWRVMKRWARENGIEVAYDGAAKAYFPSEKAGPVLGREYRVKVKRDCEEDDPDAERVRDSWFAVSFEKTISIPHADVMAALSGAEPSIEISTMLNVILKSGAVLTDGMISMEPNSSAVFFPLHMQRELLDRKVPQETKDRTKLLMSGLRMTVVFQRGGAFVQTESMVQYANKDYFEMFQRDQRHRNGTRVPLLDTSRGASIAGVRIRDPHQIVADAHTRTMIEEAVGKKKVCVVYEIKNQPGKVRIYKGKSITKDRDDRDQNSKGKGRKIIWDPKEYSFEHKAEEKSVASFFESEYGNVLKFPRMPLFYVDKLGKHGGGWLPSEYFFQEFGKSKENDEDMVNAILKYHDVYAGKNYINEVEEKLKRLSTTGGEGGRFKDRLSKWRIQIDTRAVEETAKILKAPKIKFKNDVARANNGSFNLNRVKFSMPAKVTSFAVVNFTSNKRSCYQYVQNVIEIAKNHGVDIPREMVDVSKQYLDHVAEHYNGRDDVADALEAVARAIQRAKSFYLYDSQHFYRKNNSFFRTHCFSEEGGEYECIVLPQIDNEGSLGLLLDYMEYNKDKQYFSHRITTNDGNVLNARLMVKIRETSNPIDPLDFRFRDGRHEACRRDGTWKPVTYVSMCYLCPQENDLVLNEGDIESKKFVHLVGDWEIDFPSIVFTYKPDDGKALYNRIKLMSNHFAGIQSQCAVQKKYEGQRNQDQYASNIATKINAKLSTIYDKAESWTSESEGGSGGKGGLPWIGELPTLVIGVGMVHGMGYSSKSVVAASLCLDSGCMRLSHSCFVQKKSDIISDGVMKDIIKVSIQHYVIENNCGPKRILFYRDGMSDGSFPRANDEIASIRAAAEEQLDTSIPITFVICQSQQLGFRMVPAVETVNRRGKPEVNCMSGTVLECGPNSFCLIAQGGMKGTSKPVKYIVHLNENNDPVSGHSGLTLQNLINCTNQMSWKYPSATKAVRELPMIKYAKKLGNQVLASLICLEDGCHWFGKSIKLVCPAEGSGNEEDMRPYLEMTNAKGDVIHPEHRQYNIVEMPFRNHLAA